MGLIIAPLSDVKGPGDYPEFEEAMAETEKVAFARAGELWSGATPGGLAPGGNEFGVGPLRMNDMANDTTDSTPSGSYSFRKNYIATGWGPTFSYTTRKDMIHAFVGFLIAEDVLRILQFRMQIGTNLFPIWDIQEAAGYNRFAIILKTDKGKPLVADPSTVVLVRSYKESTGNQRVVPLGISLFRRPDLVLSEV